MIIAIHLTHEAPPDKVAGIGKWLSYLLDSQSSCNAVKHIPLAMSFPGFHNYKGGLSQEGWYRTEPSGHSSNFSESLIEQNEQLFTLFESVINHLDQPLNSIIVHCHDWLCWVAAKKIRQEYSCPVILTIHTVLNVRLKKGFLELPDKKGLNLALNLQREAAKNSDVVTFFDKKSALDSTLYFSIQGIKEVLPLGIPIKKYSKQYFSPINRLRIGYLGRYASEKGCDLLCDFMKYLGPTAKLFLAGSGPLAKQLLWSLSFNEISYEHQGYVYNLENFFQNIDVLIIPSFYDPGPLTALEAICHGTPVVLSSRCGISHYLKGYTKCISIVEPNSIEFGKSVMYLTKYWPEWNAELRRVIGKLCQSELDINRTIRRLKCIYNYSLKKEKINNIILDIIECIPNGIGIKSIYLFGSTLQTEHSRDIDLLILVSEWSSHLEGELHINAKIMNYNIHTDFGISLNDDKNQLHLLFITSQIMELLSPLFLHQSINNGICIFGKELAVKKPNLHQLINSEGGLYSALSQIKNEFLLVNKWSYNKLITIQYILKPNDLPKLLEFYLRMSRLNIMEVSGFCSALPKSFEKRIAVKWINDQLEYLHATAE
ncbi:glycosyltransferase [Spartinivicinus ruber]|uniref:glycosyltransferase n=1 Tax=Spartinivicinus ruber TaxID=2683272 RepID=UPI0013D82D4D|nr:glycosyltransferase [Spartinivicinus ruber]